MEASNPEEQEIHLSDYFLVLAKHKTLIFLLTLLTVSVTVFTTMQMKPVYEAGATLVIDKEQSASPLTGQRTDYENYISQNLTFNTHFKLITSRPVIELVVRELRLDRLESGNILAPGPLQQLRERIVENLRLLLGREREKVSVDEEKNQLLATLQQKISIREVKDTRLLRVMVEDTDPAMARDLANAVGQAYIRFNLESQMQTSRNSFQWLEGQSYEIKKKLEDAERDFLSYKEENKLFSVEGRQATVAQKIREFNDAFMVSRNQRQELEAKLSQLQPLLKSNNVNILQFRSLLNNPLLEKLYGQLIDAELEKSSLTKVYKGKHTKVIQVETRIEDTTRKIREETAKELGDMEAQRQVLLAKERVLQQNITDIEDEGLATNRKELQYSILQRSVDTNQKMYDTLLAKLKEADITESLDSNNIRIAEAANLPMDPIRPKKARNLLLGMLLGLMGGIGMAFFLEYLDQSLRSEEDVARHLGLPVLTVVPLADRARDTAYGKKKG